MRPIGTQNQLAVLLGGRRVGSIVRERGELTFTYDDAYRGQPAATPLSLSMPVSHKAYDDRLVRAFLWGLLPDNDQVVQRWAQSYQVSARDPFALLYYVGADCAGAAQFIPPDRTDALLAGDGGIDWIDNAEIGRRLRTLRSDPTAWHLSATGQFSLAGAQAKTALHFDPHSGRWGDPWGAVPTTHIIKPAITGLDDHDLNEHICLQAAALVGLDAVSSDVVSFDDERAIVVERYDRLWLPHGGFQRLHQEDMCQALGVPPTLKYQNEGGPTPEAIVRLLTEHARSTSPTASERFVDALAFNWVIAGTDAHAKNYSVLLSGAQVRLSPIYDVASALPYNDMYFPNLKMAMRIGKEYTISRVAKCHWLRLAAATGLDPDQLVQRIDDIAAHIPDAFADAASREPVRAVGSQLPAELLDRVAQRAQVCRALLTAPEGFGA